MKQEDDKKAIKVPVVKDNCIGCGACVAVCDEVFAMDDEGKAYVKETDNYTGVEDAIGVCPVDAISYED